MRMRKQTSIAIGMAIATILTTYMSAFILSNQAFAVTGTSPGIHHTKQFGMTKPPKVTLKKGLEVKSG